jgi:hypothetical protein
LIGISKNQAFAGAPIVKQGEDDFGYTTEGAAGPPESIFFGISPHTLGTDSVQLMIIFAVVALVSGIYINQSKCNRIIPPA